VNSQQINVKARDDPDDGDSVSVDGETVKSLMQVLVHELCQGRHRTARLTRPRNREVTLGSRLRHAPMCWRSAAGCWLIRPPA